MAPDGPVIDEFLLSENYQRSHSSGNPRLSVKLEKHEKLRDLTGNVEVGNFHFKAKI